MRVINFRLICVRGLVPALMLSAGVVRSQTAPQLPAPLPPAPSATPRAFTQPRTIMLSPSVPVQLEQPGVIPLSLDDAITTALKNNTGLKISTEQEKFVAGQILTVGNALLPNLSVSAYTQAQEINLAAMGFKAATLKSINIPGFNPAGFSTIVKVNTTNAQINLSQQLFNVPAFYLYRAAEKDKQAANWSTLSLRGGVVLETGSIYLKTLADQTQVRNAAALTLQDQVVFDHAKASRDAGVGINLDFLRAQVELQTEQQQLISAQNAVDKDKIMLNREMGQPAGQAIELTDSVPFADFDTLTVGDALKIAYERRKDLRGLESQLEVARDAQRAVRFERLPTLGVGGFYGVLGETTGLYHGVFTAEGKLSIPVFQEGTLRGQKEVAQSQVTGLQHAVDARRVDIEGDIRGSLLDVESTRELVKVARSNVLLAGQALADARDRFTAGVDDDLPFVRAQAALVGAQTQVVQAEFQYNFAKLQLARNTGVVETEYKRYLGR